MRALAGPPVNFALMNELEFAFIGTGNAWVAEGQCWNGFLVNNKYLFETPPTAMMALQKMGTALNDIEAVLLSHHHGDHFLGLPFLLLHWKYFGRTKPLDIIGPPETELIAHMVSDRTYSNIFDTKYNLNWVVAEPGKRIQSGELSIEPVEVKHDPGLILSLGYACELGGRRFGYTGDSAMCDGVMDLARRSEVLVAECASRDKNLSVHMNFVDDMPVLRAVMKPDAHLLLTHTEGAMDTAPMVRTTAARDFERYRF